MTLAVLSNQALVAAMVVLALAMVAHGAYLARGGPARRERSDAEHVETDAREVAPEAQVRTPELVGAVGSSSSPDVRAAGSGWDTASDAPLDDDQPAGLGAAGSDADRESRAVRKLGGIAVAVTWLSGLLLLVSVVLRGLAVSRPPWGNMFEFTVAACCAAVLAYCLLARRNRWEWLGLFVTLPVLVALGIAMVALYTEAAELAPALKSYWLGIHVSMAVLAVGLFTVAFPIAIVYLLVTGSGRGLERLPRPVRRLVDAMPGPATLDRLAYGLNMVGFILWTFTLVAGAIWAHKAWSSYWNWDPKETWTFVVWAVYAAYMHGRATAGWAPRRSMWIALAGYACVIVNFTVINLWFVGQHSYSGIS